jgi:anti-sigma regulatory factor (Ser/Thr protein kinase)
MDSSNHASPASSTLEVSNRVSELARLNEFLSAFSTAHGVPDDLSMTFSVALEEAFVNVVHHAYEDGREHGIVVGLAAEGGVLAMTIEDDGKAFDPTAAAPPDTTSAVEERAIGGLGIHLIRSLMEDVVYVREHGRNRLIMKKRIHEDA